MLTYPQLSVGLRVIEVQGNGIPATITELTKEGFKYKLDRIHVISPRLNMAYQEGECLALGLPHWKLLTPKDEATALSMNSGFVQMASYLLLLFY